MIIASAMLMVSFTACDRNTTDDKAKQEPQAEQVETVVPAPLVKDEAVPVQKDAQQVVPQEQVQDKAHVKEANDDNFPKNKEEALQAMEKQLSELEKEISQTDMDEQDVAKLMQEIREKAKKMLDETGAPNE